MRPSVSVMSWSMVSLVSCSKHRSVYAPFPFFSFSPFLIFTTPIQEQGTLMLPRPAMSPAFRFLTFSSTVVMARGPMTRCVSVLRAHMSCSAGWVRSCNFPFFRLHILSSGLWFHCQMRPSWFWSKLSERRYGA